jgi:hypothetical protein
MEPRNFTYDGRQLQVRALPDSEGWRVRVFENDTLVTGVVYSVSHETTVDARMQSVPHDLVEHLMQLAQSDVENNIVRLV